MKQLRSVHSFMARHFFWAGALILLISALVPEGGAMRAIGAFMVLSGSLVEAAALVWQRWMTQTGTPHPATQVRVIIPAPNAVHIRGVFFFTLECRYQDADGTLCTVQSPLMALPRWSSRIQNGTLKSPPAVTIFEKDSRKWIRACL